MAIHLDLKGILSRPLRAETCPFRFIANGAISLLAVLPIERMPVFAVRLLRVDVRNRGTVLQRILSGGEQPEVLRVNARRVTAVMVDNHSVRDRAMHHVPCDPMRSPVFPAQKKTPVSIFIKWANPIPTPLRAILKFTGESREFFGGQVHVSLLMERMGTWNARGRQYGLV